MVLIGLHFCSDQAKTRNLEQKKESGESAYAKLLGENGREFYIREKSSLEIDIGREKRANDPNYFNLADQNTMSKKHASIFWDDIEAGFYIRNYSKNKVSGIASLNNCELKLNLDSR